MTTRNDRIKAGSRERRVREKAVLRQAILDAAGNLFADKGYDSFSMRKLAEEIGYSVATLYLYFKDKDELLFSVLDEGFLRFEQALKEASESSSHPQNRLTSIGRAYIRFGLENPAYYRLMFMHRSDYLIQARPGESEPRMATFRILQEAVAAVKNAGGFRYGSMESFSDALWASVHGCVALCITIPGLTGDRAAELAETTLKILEEAAR